MKVMEEGGMCVYWDQNSQEEGINVHVRVFGILVLRLP